MGKIAFLIGLATFFSIMALYSYLTFNRLESKLEEVKDQRKLLQRLKDNLARLGNQLMTLPLIKDVINLEDIELKLRMINVNMTGAQFVGIWSASTVAGVIMGIFSTRILPPYAVPFFVLVGFVLPGAILNNRTNWMKLKFERDFIVFAEKILMGCSGGIDVYTMLQRTSQGMDFLSNEVKRLVEDMQTNSTNKGAALDRFAMRLQNPTVNNFVNIIKNHEINGVGFYDELIDFIASLRATRSSKIEGIARKMESKLLFPVVLSILPAAFILLIIPFIIIVMGGLSQ